MTQRVATVKGEVMTGSGGGAAGERATSRARYDRFAPSRSARSLFRPDAVFCGKRTPSSHGK